MTDTRTRQSRAHSKAVQFTTADVAAYLQEALGQKLVAHMAGVTDGKAVGRWAKGEVTPRTEAERRLRAAFQIFHLLQSEESPYTIRAWFIGMNPQLDDQSPAEVIADGRTKDALVAAKAFIAGG